MSYNFQAFFAVGLPEAHAGAAALHVANALRSAGVLGTRIERESGMPGVATERFETGDGIAALFEKTAAFVGTVGGEIEIVSGRYVNGWAFNQISEARCAACSKLFRWEDGGEERGAFEAVLAAMVDAVEPYFHDGEPGEVACPSCGVAGRGDKWSCDVATGFSTLAVEFHHLPPFNSQVVETAGWSFDNGLWRIDVPRIISDAAGCQFGSTWGRI